MKAEKELISQSLFRFIQPTKSEQYSNQPEILYHKDAGEALELKVRTEKGQSIDVEFYSSRLQSKGENQIVLHNLTKVKTLLREMHHRVRRSLNEVFLA